MTDKDFEKWWCEHGIKFITEKLACFGAWQEKQREIDALKHKLAITDAGFRAAEHLITNYRSEIDALKAEVERLCNSIPKTPEAMIAFIGSHFNAMRPVGGDGKPTGSLDAVTYSLTVHDLLSAFAWAGLDQYEIDAAMKETK